jgi:hypothetical protein
MTELQHSRYRAINSWCQLTDMKRGAVYLAITRGDLRAVKVGRRTLIDVQQGLAWLDGLPAPDIRIGRSKTPA